MEQQLKSMGTVGTLFQIVYTLANSTALAPWGLYRSRLPRQDRDIPLTPVNRHAAVALWQKPNPFFTTQELVETVQQHIDLVGEGYLLVVRDPMLTFPTGLWPLSPARMTPIEDPTEFLKGWIYTGPSGEQVPLGLDEVIQLRVPNPVDPYRGIGAVQTILSDLESAKLSAEWNRNFFLNSAQPGGILAFDGQSNDVDLDQLQAKWNEQHRGVPNAHRVAMLEGNVKWVPMQFSHDDMQFVQLRNISRDVIREAFGVSKTMLGDTESVNRATAEAAQIVFARDKIKPRLERWKQALNNDLLPMFGSAGSGVEFDYEITIPEDQKAEAAELKSKTDGAAALVAAGWHPDDVLTALDLPPMRFVGPSAAPTSPAGSPATTEDDEGEDQDEDEE